MILTKLTFFDFPFDSENKKLSFSPIITNRQKLNITFRNETNSDEKKMIIFWVPINIVTGNPAINTIRGISMLRNSDINPIFLISFFENGRVRNHLKEFPDIKELVEIIPNINIYKNVIRKYIPNMKLDINDIEFDEYKPKDSSSSK